jgi:hypothetical protein
MVSKILIMLWLLAGESNGNLPDAATIAFRLRLPQTKIEQALTTLSPEWLECIDTDSRERLDSVYTNSSLDQIRLDQNRSDKNKMAQQASPKFIKPTPAEVTEYAKTIGFRIDGDYFCSFYEARGWKYSRGLPMKNWKAAVVTWKKNNTEKTDEATERRQRKAAQEYPEHIEVPHI